MRLKLTFGEALPLARKLRSDLRPHTRDLKSHGRCFEDRHAVEWARDNTDSDEEAAVGRLNDLVEWGLLVHTVDPFKRFGVGGTTSSYYRTADAILDAEQTSSTGPGSPKSSENAGGRTAMTTALTFREARFLALKLRANLAPHTRNRRHRFKSCGKCFRASRALKWARENIDLDEEAAVRRLNELVDLGLLVIVDPPKTFEAGESRALYLRTVDSLLDAELTYVAKEESVNLGIALRPTDGGELERPKLILVKGEIGSRMNIVRANAKANANPTANLHLDHISQWTARVLNDARGNLEVVRHDWSVRRCRG